MAKNPQKTKPTTILVETQECLVGSVSFAAGPNQRLFEELDKTRDMQF